MRSAASSRRAPFTAPALGRLRLRPPEPPSPPDTQSTQSSAGTDRASRSTNALDVYTYVGYVLELVVLRRRRRGVQALSDG